MIAPALRRACGILDGEPLDVRRQKLRARVLRHASGEVRHTTEFLGELVDAPFPDDDSFELRAARQDPMVMGEHLKRAFEHFIATETAAQPLLIVLEDLHWGDLPTVKLIDSALQALPDRPWFVLALARPDVHDLFPRLWSERGVQEIRLDELTRKGSERLIRKVLGETTADALVAKLIDRAHGNAFYLEELIRAVADGKQDAMPETVLAVVQGRLERAPGDARRVLRAASVFGQQFWRGGVTALLGGSAKQTSTDEWLGELVQRELIARSPTSRFPGEHEYLFRHALVREAAYAMLTDGDRRLGHQLAGSWLESSGEGDATALAEHFERGGEAARAIEHYRRAVEQVLAAGDFRNVISRGERGIACGAGGTLRGALRLAQAEAHKWCGEFADAARCGLEAMSFLPHGAAGWFAAASEAAQATGKLDSVAALAEIGEALRTAQSVDGDLRSQVIAIAHAAFELYAHGNYPLAEELLARIEHEARATDDPAILARVWQGRAYRAMYAGDAGALLEAEQAAAAEFERAGDLRYACLQRGYVGYACVAIGAYAEAERALRDALEAATRLGLQNVVATAKHNLGRTLGLLGRNDEGLLVELEALAAFGAQGDRRLECGARLYCANLRFDLADFDGAERDLRAALELANRPSTPQVLASLARVLLATGRAGAAFVAARDANDQLEELGGSIEEGEALVRLMLAETLAATGERAAARRAANRARERLQTLAEKISDPEWRRCFLEQVPEHARTLALQAELAA
jgi:tetratricopeptide (TPR) repeat protein